MTNSPGHPWTAGSADWQSYLDVLGPELAEQATATPDAPAPPQKVVALLRAIFADK